MLRVQYVHAAMQGHSSCSSLLQTSAESAQLEHCFANSVLRPGLCMQLRGLAAVREPTQRKIEGLEAEVARLHRDKGDVCTDLARAKAEITACEHQVLVLRHPSSCCWQQSHT